MQRNIIAILCAAALFAGCAKNKLEENKYWNIQPGNANIKFIHSYTSLFPSVATPATGPVVDYFVNGERVSGTSSTVGVATAISYGAVFPTVSGQYASVATGDVSIKAALYRATGTALPTDVIFDGKFKLDGGKYYSAFLVDTMPAPAPANVNIAIVNDDVSRAKSGFFKMRFAHMIPTLDTLEIVSKNSNAVLIGNVTYKTASGFIELPLLTKNDTIQLRKKGTTAVLTEQRPFFPSSERVYTFFCRGLYGTTSGTRARTLTNYINQ
jgi:Domain of unknown function (DUF4397)